MTRTRYRFGDESYPHFITNTVVAWLPVFSQPRFADIVLESWRFLQEERAITVLAYVVLENHLHWIATGPKLARRVGEFKSFTARSILNAMHEMNYGTSLQELRFYKLRHKVGQQFQLWQEGSKPKIIMCEAILRQKIEYIHNNPLRRGYVDHPVDWRYSSARNYAGKPGLVEVCTNW